MHFEYRWIKIYKNFEKTIQFFQSSLSIYLKNSTIITLHVISQMQIVQDIAK